MRTLLGDLATRVETGAARLCHVWLLRRADGGAMGFTDHDRDLVFQDMLCRAGSGWTQGAGETGVSTEGMFSVAGGLDDEAVSEADIAQGLFDGAQVELWRVDWADVAACVCLWSGRMRRLRREGGGFVADLEGALAQLDRVVGRTYGRDCDARLGDARCGLTAQQIGGRTCDNSWRTCTQVFANGRNYRGFPDMPGDDFIVARPLVGGRNDGRSRR